MLHGDVAFQVVAIEDELLIYVMLSFKVTDQATKSVPLSGLVFFGLVLHSWVMLSPEEDRQDLGGLCFGLVHLLKPVEEQFDVFLVHRLVLGQNVADGLLALNSLFGEHFDTVHRSAMQLLHQAGFFVLLHLLLEQCDLVGDLRLSEHFQLDWALFLRVLLRLVSHVCAL